MIISLSLFTLLLTLTSLASLIRRDEWWIRIFDFPRLQLSILIILAIIISLLLLNFSEFGHFLIFLVLLGNLIFQGWKIYPYTIFAPITVKKFRGPATDNAISILVSNVLTPNRKVDLLLKQIRKYQPDLVLTLESDKWWQEKLSVLSESYPYRINVPLDNLYGMHLFSKLSLEEQQVNYLIKPDIPSIEALIKLRSGKLIKIYCLHPEPPSPTENDASTERDAEILLTAKKMNAQNYPGLVFGDLNDVAWSKTTTLFQKTSHLMDPRKGRGFYSTYNAKYPFLRWPLDHIFHSSEFQLVQIKRLSNIGSDHFPLFTKLQLSDNDQEGMQATKKEKERADDKIAKVDSNQ
ncbi:MAG: endonuclease/exonuclease/phosphatase family protein [Cytophagales bacterium]